MFREGNTALLAAGRGHAKNLTAVSATLANLLSHGLHEIPLPVQAVMMP